MSRVVAWLKGFTDVWGGPGLLVIGFLDSSFISLPEINDLLLMGMVIEHPYRVLYYSFLATLGSVLGCLALYLIAG